MCKFLQNLSFVVFDFSETIFLFRTKMDQLMLIRFAVVSSHVEFVQNVFNPS